MTQVWAHRGASAREPENTMPAFELARRQGADGLEFDVQRTADGVLVVVHDETLDRTTDRTGAVAQLPAREVLRADAGSWRTGLPARIPTLAEVLDFVADAGLRCNIELKNSVIAYPGIEADVAALVRASRVRDTAREQLVCSSFNHRSLARLAAIAPGLPTGVLVVERLVDPWRYVAQCGGSALHPLWTSIDAADVAALHRRGMAVHAWTADDPADVARLAGWGIDAIITNTPDVALAALGRGPVGGGAAAGADIGDSGGSPDV